MHSHCLPQLNNVETIKPNFLHMQIVRGLMNQYSSTYTYKGMGPCYIKGMYVRPKRPATSLHTSLTCVHPVHVFHNVLAYL